VTPAEILRVRVETALDIAVLVPQCPEALAYAAGLRRAVADFHATLPPPEAVSVPAGRPARQRRPAAPVAADAPPAVPAPAPAPAEPAAAPGADAAVTPSARSPWTPDRLAALADGVKRGTARTALIAALNALPGAYPVDAKAIRNKAHKLGLRRDADAEAPVSDAPATSEPPAVATAPEPEPEPEPPPAPTPVALAPAAAASGPDAELRDALRDGQDVRTVAEDFGLELSIVSRIAADMRATGERRAA